MTADLAAAIESLEIPPVGEALVEAIALRDRLDARLAGAASAVEASGWWAGDASVSFVAWLRAHARMTRRSAQRLRTLAVRLRSLPVCAQAYADGSLSGGQIEAIVALLDDETVPIFAAHEAELVPYLVPLSVAGVSRAMGAWVSRARPEQKEPTEPDRSVHLSRTLDDRWVLEGSLDPEAGAVVSTALRLATPEQADASRTPATRRADALIDVCRFFLDHQHTRTGGRNRPHLNVVVDLEELESRRGGQVVDGPRLDGRAVSRLFCDSAVHRVVMSGRSAILDYGTASRTIPTPLWNALVIRDEHCRFPDCDRPSVWCEGHHVVWVTEGGPTELANLALLCSRHHHVLHQTGWHAKLLADSTFEVTDPNGQVRITSPPRELRLPDVVPDRRS
ncbi:MAG TPA: DUF222 domain-containing protein [Acidimicrobiales bacterium]|nr:DUF222 domain-containing protein [Acidimicrobiales bacterium]